METASAPEPEFYRTSAGNLSNQAVAPLDHEKWISEQLDSNEWMSVPPNPSFIYFGEDIWTAELPTQKHVLLTCMRLKSRGKNPALVNIEVGSGIITKPPHGDTRQIWIVAQIQVRFSKKWRT
jgi:hypothetical protein